MSAERPLVFPREPRLLNIGCGGTWHPDWLNGDVEPLSAEVRRLDARCRIPIADGSCDAVYYSHQSVLATVALEHTKLGVPGAPPPVDVEATDER